MKAFKIIGIIFLGIVWNSCQSGKSIAIGYKEFEIKYIYKTQSILTAQTSIERSIKITNQKNDKSLMFDMDTDIEHLDEPRFFQIDLIELDGTEYQNLIWIEDPFAFVIVDLKNMKTLYNSHGEDDILERVKIKSKKYCLGKIRFRKLILDDCTITF